MTWYTSPYADRDASMTGAASNALMPKTTAAAPTTAAPAASPLTFDSFVHGMSADQFNNGADAGVNFQSIFDGLRQMGASDQQISGFAPWLAQNFQDPSGQFGKYAQGGTVTANLQKYLQGNGDFQNYGADAGSGGGWLTSGSHLLDVLAPGLRAAATQSGRVSNMLADRFEAWGIPSSWAHNWGTALNPGSIATTPTLTDYYAGRERGMDSTDARQWTTSDNLRSLVSAAAVYGGGVAAGGWGGASAAGGGSAAGSGAGAGGAFGTAEGIGGTTSGLGAGGTFGTAGGIGGTVGAGGAVAGAGGGTAAAGAGGATSAAGGLMSGYGAYAPLLGSALGALGSYFGSRAQADAAQRGIDAQMHMFDITRAGLAPYMGAGYGALNPLMNLLGAGPQGAGGMQSALENLPGYQFALTQGLKGVQNSAAARGLGSSGAALKGAANYATGLAQQNWGSYADHLYNLAGLGENAAAGVGNAAVQTGRGLADSYGNLGAANASGYLGASNAFGQGLNQYYLQYLLQQQRQQQQGLYGP